jgi:hypothetical protein
MSGWGGEVVASLPLQTSKRCVMADKIDENGQMGTAIATEGEYTMTQAKRFLIRCSNEL